MVAPRARSPRAFFRRGEDVRGSKSRACPDLSRGELDAGDRLSIFRRRHTRRPARRFLTEDLRSCRRSGLRCRTQACQSFRPLHRSDAPVLSRSASSLFGGPAVVRGGRIRRPSPKKRRELTELASASRAHRGGSPWPQAPLPSHTTIPLPLALPGGRRCPDVSMNWECCQEVECEILGPP